MRGLFVFGVKSLLTVCNCGTRVVPKRQLCSRAMDSTQNFLQFLKLVGNLKHLPRTGWVMRGVKDPETVASHMYRMAMMSYAIHPSETNMDMNKVLKMALVHDLAESLVGDITPYDGVSRKRKRQMETDAMVKIAKLLGRNKTEVVTLFKEYENQKSAEARFVKQLDSLDMRLQAFEYEKKEGVPGKYQEFIDSTEGKFTHPDIVALVREIDRERAMFADANGVGDGDILEDEDIVKIEEEEDVSRKDAKLTTEAGVVTSKEVEKKEKESLPEAEPIIQLDGKKISETPEKSNH
ncbi:hypothetical protein GE061_003345 [Apolygus lucorum]|uniref:5'-deoxynucleotidase HDDC2 n=1 Tax=Apolygus lucorum TaxID=248454 RepID=A0A6A4IJ52_APOLU|nr:hypothetical protein GE061_003345 [Apolygus lucorum]